MTSRPEVQSMSRIGYFLLLWTIASVMMCSVAHAQSDCGNPPRMDDEALKAEIGGQANLPKGRFGDAEVNVQIQQSKKDILNKYPRADELRINTYYQYQACVIIMNDNTLSTVEKLDWISRVRREVTSPTGSSEGGDDIDPRKALSDIGVKYNVDSFYETVSQKDYRAVDLFFRLGMNLNQVEPGMTGFKFFLGNFDPKIAGWIIKYQAVDPILSCPTPPNSMYADYSFYTSSQITTEEINFIGSICNNDMVLRKFDAALLDLKNEAEKESIQRKKNQRNQRVQGHPLSQSDISMRNAGNYMMDERARILGPSLSESWEDQLIGWTQARKYLVDPSAAVTPR